MPERFLAFLLLLKHRKYFCVSSRTFISPCPFVFFDFSLSLSIRSFWCLPTASRLCAWYYFFLVYFGSLPFLGQKKKRCVLFGSHKWFLGPFGYWVMRALSECTTERSITKILTNIMVFLSCDFCHRTLPRRCDVILLMKTHYIHMRLYNLSWLLKRY